MILSGCRFSTEVLGTQSLLSSFAIYCSSDSHYTVSSSGYLPLPRITPPLYIFSKSTSASAALEQKSLAYPFQRLQVLRGGRGEACRIKQSRLAAFWRARGIYDTNAIDYSPFSAYFAVLAYVSILPRTWLSCSCGAHSSGTSREKRHPNLRKSTSPACIPFLHRSLPSSVRPFEGDAVQS